MLITEGGIPEGPSIEADTGSVCTYSGIVVCIPKPAGDPRGELGGQVLDSGGEAKAFTGAEVGPGRW